MATTIRGLIDWGLGPIEARGRPLAGQVIDLEEAPKQGEDYVYYYSPGTTLRRSATYSYLWDVRLWPWYSCTRGRELVSNTNGSLS